MRVVMQCHMSRNVTKCHLGVDLFKQCTISSNQMCLLFYIQYRCTHVVTIYRNCDRSSLFLVFHQMPVLNYNSSFTAVSSEKQLSLESTTFLHLSVVISKSGPTCIRAHFKSIRWNPDGNAAGYC